MNLFKFLALSVVAVVAVTLPLLLMLCHWLHLMSQPKVW